MHDKIWIAIGSLVAASIAIVIVYQAGLIIPLGILGVALGANDKTYGIKDNGNRLYLHANRLKLYYPHIKKEILFESKNPIEFKKIMK